VLFRWRQISWSHAHRDLGQRRLALWSRSGTARVGKWEASCQFGEAGTHHRQTSMNPGRKCFHLALASIACVLFVLSACSQPVPIDFSTAGYAAHEKPIPNAPVRVVVSPQPGDSTARIQAAIDYVSSLSPDTNGLRGAVLLLAGRHEVLGSLLITNSGVVLRGQGIH